MPRQNTQIYKASWNRLLNNWYTLYKAPTDAERAIEPAIAALGRRYRAQHLIPAASCIVDFALLDERLVIEVDGASHSSKDAKAKDAKRTARLQKLGWTVARCTNAEAMSDPTGTVARLLERT